MASAAPFTPAQRALLAASAAQMRSAETAGDQAAIDRARNARIDLLRRLIAETTRAPT